MRAAHGARKHSFTTACELLEDTLGASTRHAYAAETEAISSLQVHPQFAATLVTFAYQRLDRKHPIAEDVLAAVSKELDAVREATAGVAPLDPDALGVLAAEAVSRVRVRVAGIEDLTIDRAAVLAGWPGELGPVTSATPGLLRALLAPPA